MKKNEQLRFLVSIGIAILLLVLSIFIAFKIISGKKKPEVVVQQLVKTVYVDTVQNQSLSLDMNASGALEAYRKVELYSEVQGILQSNGQIFKAGQAYSAGSTLLSISDSEFAASIVAQRSALYNQIMSAMPDLQLDYPNVYPKWQSYLNNFNINQNLSALPSLDSDQEKYFINSRNIITTFYNIENLEERLLKYQIKAPFNGIVTEALVNNGTLIRAGQKLGEFIDPSQYELKISIGASINDLVKVGKTVELNNIDKTESYTGKITRINNVVDPSTQSIQVFITISSNKLNEGQYLEAQLEGKKVDNVFEIPRKLLVDNKEIFTVVDDKLKKISVDIIHFTRETAIIKNLKEGTIILQKNIPGAYDGMLVNIAK
jgi:multidrug efflux pump subunit AcrA (membrane-fusion protein)